MFADRILILIPHPDDEVVGAAAAIARARAAGAAVFGLYLTTGVPGPDTPWLRNAAARAARRRDEALKAAERMGVAPTAFLDHPTRTLRLNLETVLAIARATVSALKPGAIWVPAFEGAHQDHDSANALASLLAAHTPVWEFAEYGNGGGRIRRQSFPRLFGTETEIPLTAVEAAEKQALLALYASERGNLKHIGTDRECFRPLAAYDYSLPPHEGTLFYARFQWVPFRHPRIDFTPPTEVAEDIGRFLKDQAVATDTASSPF